MFEGCFRIENGKRTDWFELKGVLQPVLSHWSSRRKEILQETELLPGVRSAVKARQNANLRTRQSKAKSQQLDENAQRDEWRMEAKRLGFTGATCHLSENFRQRNSPEDAKAAAHVRGGDIDKMLESYAERGRLTVAQNRIDATNQLVSEWVKDGGVKEPQKAFILTQTRAEAKQLNKLCQEARRFEAASSSKSAVIQNQVYHVGDRVMFHKKILKKGIENGYQGAITGIDKLKKTVTFRLVSRAERGKA